MTLSLTPVVVPASLDEPDAADFLTLIDRINVACRHDLGSDHLDDDPRIELANWHDQRDCRLSGLLARRDGEAVGAIILRVPQDAGTVSAEFELAVHPVTGDDRVGELLLGEAERQARAHGRRVLQAYTVHRVDQDVPRLVSPAGLGSVPLDEKARFYRAHGMVLGQVERNSNLDLTAPLDGVRERLDRALQKAGADYRVVTWTIPTPERYKDDYARMQARMSTDPPAGDIDWPIEQWDAARIDRREATFHAGGQTMSVAGVEHIPTGELVAFSELVIGTDRTRPTHQWGTLVLPEHRGHRLGMIVKCANILRWHELVPESPFITTFNAEENRPMLDVNEAVGFVAVAYAAAWQKELASDPKPEPEPES
ncbi:GNAT family N-acetyltransferase [Microbacterium sp.]|uniref:GNAT family N-acetyltransferase n=1 Tax=Microbacterium sp. TaxID=51671 RepID=UPI0039E3835A